MSKESGQPLTPEGDSGRRTFLKASIGAAAAPMILTARRSGAQITPPPIPPSPPTIPWEEEIPAYTYTAKSTVSGLSPDPTGAANTGGGECGRGQHQSFPLMPDLYELRAREFNHRFNPAYPDSRVWGLDSRYPGPTFRCRYLQPVLVRMHNELPQDHVGFGSPEMTVHLHNGHTPSESDGFPGDFFSPVKAGPTLTAAGQYRDHLYPNVYAGLEQYPETGGDPREALGTLWYHDHTLDFTGPNVYKGLAGFYLLYDHIDNGDETVLLADNPSALRLPYGQDGEFDVPLMLQDKRFDTSGVLSFEQLSASEGTIGDKVVVNGKIEPFFRVAARKYRLRLLNGGPARMYELSIINAANAVQLFTYIANDGNLLPAPLFNRARVNLGVAERADIIVDFGNYPKGTELYLINRLLQLDTRKPEKDLLSVASSPRILKFIVDDPLEDSPPIPATLRELPPLNLSEAVRTRVWTFDRKNGVWIVNGQVFNVNQRRAVPKKGTAEIWELRNLSGGWTHPVHIHFEEGFIIRRSVGGTNVAVPVHERGRKDVYVIGPHETIRLFMRFRDFVGKYPTHCHNLYHEDHAMMFRWDIEP